MQTVGIIGGAGYIGSHVSKKFLEEGYRIKVSATDPSRTEKYAHLQKLPHADRIELAALDVRNSQQLQDFLQGCSVVIHGGTPFQLEVDDPAKDLFEPTIKGTENFLKAIQQTPGLKKAVFIASVAAHNTRFPLYPLNREPGQLIDEDGPRYMSEEDHPYAQAKFLAHQAVERVLAEQADFPVEITTVSPVGVMGNALSAREDSASMGIQHLVKNQIAPNPFVQMLFDQDAVFAIVDVADVAEGVYQAATRTGLHGKDYLLTSESYHMSDMTRMLNQQPPHNKPQIVYQNQRAIDDLGVRFRPVRETLHAYGG